MNWSGSSPGTCPMVTGSWVVTVGEDRVVGTRTSARNGDPKAVKLNLRTVGDYDVLRIHDERRNVATAARRDSIVWRTERRKYVDSKPSDSTVRARPDILTGPVVLTASPNVIARARINSWLKDNIRFPATEVECNRDAESCFDGWDGDVRFANARLFAIAGATYWSGNAYPKIGFIGTNGFVAMTFDLHTGQEVDWRKIFRLDEGEPGTHALDLTRRDLLAAHVLRAAMGERGCAMYVADYYGCAQDACTTGPGRDAAGWSLYPVETGLAVATGHGEPEQECRGDAVIIPWHDVRETLIRPMIVP